MKLPRATAGYAAGPAQGIYSKRAGRAAIHPQVFAVVGDDSNVAKAFSCLAKAYGESLKGLGQLQLKNERDSVLTLVGHGSSETFGGHTPEQLVGELVARGLDGSGIKRLDLLACSLHDRRPSGASGFAANVAGLLKGRLPDAVFALANPKAEQGYHCFLYGPQGAGCRWTLALQKPGSSETEASRTVEAGEVRSQLLMPVEPDAGSYVPPPVTSPSAGTSSGPGVGGPRFSPPRKRRQSTDSL